MGIEDVLRKAEGSDSNWDSIMELEKQGKFDSDAYKKKMQKRRHFKVRFGRSSKENIKGAEQGQGETAPKVEPTPESTATENPEATAENTDVTEEDDYESETTLSEEYYGFDEGHQEGELDYQTSTLEYQILHYPMKPKDKIDLMRQLPDSNRERVDFVDKYIDLFQECPSSGRSFSQAEAFAIFRDYKEYASSLKPEEVPSSKMGVLLELETMLEKKMADAKEAGDEKTYKSCEKAFYMISDLETSEAVEEYYSLGEASQDRGSALAMRSYIKGIIDREGYAGTKEMRDHKPPIEGGALRLERNFKILEMLQPHYMQPGETTDDGRVSTEEDPILADYPIADLVRDLERTDFTAEDWRFIEQFSHRGKEFHDYVNAINEAKKDRRNREDYRKRAESYDRTIKWLRSDTPTEELPEQVQEMLKREKLTNQQIAGRFYEAETSTRARIKMLRGDGDLPEVIQQALDASGQSRSEYADSLEAKADELHQKALDAYRGKMTKEQREAADKVPIRREELARRQEESRDALLASARVSDAQYRAVKKMLERTPEKFAQQVLLSEIEGMPQVPEDVQEYLFRNYGKDTTALKVMTGKPGSKSFYVDRLRQLRRTVRKDAVRYGKTAKYQESRFGKDLGLDYATGAVEKEPSRALREEESFINEKVLPALDQIITKIGGEIPYDEEERKAQGVAEEEPAEEEEATNDGERIAA